VTIASIVMTLRVGKTDAKATNPASARPEPAR
jgi:hypothetical protein